MSIFLRKMRNWKMAKSSFIPEEALDNFCYYIKDVIKAFYDNPENQKAFEKWLSEREERQV